MTPAPWKIGAIRIATPDGIILVPGWHNGTFGIDWRPQSPVGMAYVITHMASGHSLCALLANLEDLQDIADRLTRDFVWPTWTDLNEIRDSIARQRDALRAFCDREGLDDRSLCLPPPGNHPTISTAEA